LKTEQIQVKKSADPLERALKKLYISALECTQTWWSIGCRLKTEQIQVEKRADNKLDQAKAGKLCMQPLAPAAHKAIMTSCWTIGHAPREKRFFRLCGGRNGTQLNSFRLNAVEMSP
jgi:hypothetical protein